MNVRGNIQSKFSKLGRSEGEQKLPWPLKKKFGKQNQILVGRSAGRGSIGVSVKEGLNQIFPREFVEWETVCSNAKYEIPKEKVVLLFSLA